MNIMEKVKKICLFTLAIVTTICISISNTNSCSGNDFKWIIILIILYILFNNVQKILNKRLIILARNI